MDSQGDPEWRDWSDITVATDSETGRISYTVCGLTIGAEYTFEVWAVNDVDIRATSRVTVTPARRGAVAVVRSTLTGDTKCFGYADGAGVGVRVDLFGHEVTSGVKSAFDVIAKGTDPTNGWEYYPTEYYLSGAAGDEIITVWLAKGCFAPLSNAVIDSLPVTWPPVRGEWTFEANIDPNPNELPTGDETGATVTFRAIYTVTSGDPTDLKAEIGGVTKLLSGSFGSGVSEVDSVRIGIGADLGSTLTVTNDVALTNGACAVDDTTVTCTYDVLDGSKLLAAVNATPGGYPILVELTDATFIANASTADDVDFVSASAANPGPFNLNLEVIPGPPLAPTGLTAKPGNSRVTLEWEDPENPNITGYQYQQTETQPGTTLSWKDPNYDTISNWQYRKTTTQPGIDLSWSTPSGLLLGDSVYYEYRLTTDGDLTDPNNPIPDFPDSWEVIPDSTLGTTSYKVTGIDTTIPHYF